MFTTRVTILVLSILLAATVTAVCQEQTIQRADVPKAVLDAFTKAYPKATIKGFSRETENDKTVYEIESTDGKISRDITYASDGSVRAIEESMSFTALPKAVTDALRRDYPKAERQKCEKVQENGQVTYELLIELNDETYELVYRADGTLVKKEQKQEEDEDEADGHK